MKVVIDCNVFVTALSSRSPYHPIVTSLLNGTFSLHISTEICLEFSEKIRDKFSSAVANAFLDALYTSPYVVQSEPTYRWNLIVSDDDDNKYIDCYIKSNADFIVTNDKHFNILKQTPFPTVRCITIDEFMELLQPS